MASAGCYPQMLVQMVAVGEETGTLDGNLEITAEFYSKEVDQKVDALTAMMTPALTIVIGCLVGFIALSLIMPMYQILGHVNEAGAGTAPPTMIARLHSERGVTLVETLVAVGILGLALVVFLAGLQTGLISTRQSDSLSTAHELARSQMEYTKAAAYQAAPATYATVTPVSGYAVTANASAHRRRRRERPAHHRADLEGWRALVHARRLQGEPLMRGDITDAAPASAASDSSNW